MVGLGTGVPCPSFVYSPAVIIMLTIVAVAVITIIAIAIIEVITVTITAQKMEFFIKDFFSKCDQIHSFLHIWSHLLNKSLMGNFFFFAVNSKNRINQK